jgi:hypothetical protein
VEQGVRVDPLSGDGVLLAIEKLEVGHRKRSLTPKASGASLRYIRQEKRWMSASPLCIRPSVSITDSQAAEMFYSADLWGGF